METEFIVRDPARLNLSENVVRATDEMLHRLDKMSGELLPSQPELAESLEAVADLIQAVVLKHTGVEVRPAGCAAIDLEAGEIALNALRKGFLQIDDTEYQKESVGPSIWPEPPAENDRRMVVLVESDRIEREAICQSLECMGVSFRAFADCDSAFRSLDQIDHDVTFLLAVKRAGEAYAAARSIRGQRRDNSIQVVAICSDNATLSESDAEAVDACMQRPFQPGNLAAILQHDGSLTAAQVAA